jgi:hypothetical protein
MSPPLIGVSPSPLLQKVLAGNYKMAGTEEQVLLWADSRVESRAKQESLVRNRIPYFQVEARNTQLCLDLHQALLEADIELAAYHWLAGSYSSFCCAARRRRQTPPR